MKIDFHNAYIFTLEHGFREFIARVTDVSALEDVIREDPERALTEYHNWKRDQSRIMQQALVSMTQRFGDRFGDQMHNVYKFAPMACVWQCHEFEDVVHEKNFYHQMVKVYGYDALPLIKGHSLLGEAYICAMGNPGPNEETFLPSAESIFEILKKKLWRLERMGYVWPKEVHEQFM